MDDLKSHVNKLNNRLREEKPYSFIQFWGWRIIALINFLVFHFIVSIAYFGKGKTVPPVKQNLLLKPATVLAEEIRSGKLKSESVVQAYIERINEVQPIINAVVVNFFQDALKQAREVDTFIASGKLSANKIKESKPLLGVPVTVKHSLKIKGHPSTAGCIKLKNNVANVDSTSVTLLKESGAIILAMSNLSELCSGFDSINKLYGRTCNPYNTNRTAGGSSGGEAALLAAAGSVIGVGSDLSGSIRIPAHFNGIFSHKPSLGWVPSIGSMPKPNEEWLSYCSDGPMTRYPEDLITVMKVLSSKVKEKIDFERPVNFKNLKIFYLLQVDDPLSFSVDKEILVAMKKALNHFRDSYGAHVEEVNIQEFYQSFFTILNILHYEFPNFNYFTEGNLDRFNRPLEILKSFFDQSDYDLWVILSLGLGKNPIGYNEKYYPFYKKVVEKMKEKFEDLLDDDSVFFLPTFPVSAPRPYGFMGYIGGIGYCGMFNFLGLPATQCPLSLNKDGMPFGMQIVGKMKNDSLTLACAVELGKVFGGWIPPS